jgi:short subunit dehydrogenase-like uncharacterized protein
LVGAGAQDLHRDPCYLSTARMLLELALCIALQPGALNKDPYASKHAGGVLTPASAAGTVLIERLKKAGDLHLEIPNVLHAPDC